MNNNLRVKININVIKDKSKPAMATDSPRGTPWNQLKKEILDEVKDWYFELYEK